MSRYANEDLKEMATTALESKELGEVRWAELTHILSHLTGMSYQVVDRKITELANWKETEENA